MAPEVEAELDMEMEPEEDMELGVEEESIEPASPVEDVISMLADLSPDELAEVRAEIDALMAE